MNSNDSENMRSDAPITDTTIPAIYEYFLEKEKKLRNDPITDPAVVIN